MAGARPSSFKKGGGFLNNVVATLTKYEFSDGWNGEAFKPGKIDEYKNGKPTGKKIDKTQSLNVFLSYRVDGADEDIITTLKAAGDFNKWAIEDDGYVVVGVDENGDPDPSVNFSNNAAFSKLLASYIKPVEGGDGFPEERLPEDAFDFRALLGTRARLIQQTDDERTKKFGPRKDKKSGKEYDRQDLVVAEVLELPSEGKAVKGSKTAAKPVVAAKGSTKGKAKAEEEAADTDIEQLAKETLVRILLKKDGKKAEKAKLSMPILKALMNDEENRDAVRDWIFDDSNLAALADGDEFEVDEASYSITYNKSKGLITLVEG